MTGATPPPSRLFDLLPALYREGQGGFLDALLGAFEAVLLGRPGAAGGERGVGQVIDGLASLFDPQTAPEEFLPWLAGWVAFTFSADLNTDQKRQFLGRIVSLYPRRGTRQNLQDLLELFTVGVGNARVTEDQAPDAQLGVRSTLDRDFYLEGGPPYSFTVTIFLGSLPPDEQERQVQVARALVDAEKPAHTVYRLVAQATGVVLGKAVLGVNTVLGAVAPA